MIVRTRAQLRGQNTQTSRPDLVAAAQAILAGAGLQATCSETLIFNPLGNYYDRQCSVTGAPDRYNCDLIVSNPAGAIAEIKGAIANANYAVTPQPPTNQPPRPPATPPPPPPPPPPAPYTPPPPRVVYTPPTGTPPPGAPPTDPGGSLIDRLWRVVYQSGAPTTGRPTAGAPGAESIFDRVPRWAWLAAGAAAAYLLTKGNRR